MYISKLGRLRDTSDCCCRKDCEYSCSGVIVLMGEIWPCNDTVPVPGLRPRAVKLNEATRKASIKHGRTLRLSVSFEDFLSNSCKISWEQISFVLHREKLKSWATGFLWLGTPGFTPNSQQENMDPDPGTAYPDYAENSCPWSVRLQPVDTQVNGFQAGFIFFCFSKKFFFNWFYKYGCLVCLYVCAVYPCLVFTETREPVQCLGVELQMIVSYHVNAGNRSQVLWKMSHLSSPWVSFSYSKNGVTVPPHWALQRRKCDLSEEWA